MSDTNPLPTAVSRLAKSLESLDKLIDQRIQRETVLVDAEAEVQRIGADRVRLAESLDKAEERNQRLDSVNREVSRRLVDAMESIRAVLEK